MTENCSEACDLPIIKLVLHVYSEAPGSYVEGEWEGNVRAIKWRDQEGTVHQGCKGTIMSNTFYADIGYGFIQSNYSQNQQYV